MLRVVRRAREMAALTLRTRIHTMRAAAAAPAASTSGRVRLAAATGNRLRGLASAAARGERGGPRGYVRGAEVFARAAGVADGEGNATLDESTVEVVRDYCPGCGIRLQSDRSDAPGFYREPERVRAAAAAAAGVEGGALEATGIADSGAAPLDAAPAPLVYCARCFSLRNYGRVKDPAIEERLPLVIAGP